MLKEYELKDTSEWKRLAKEVKLLHLLAHPHITTVEAMFVQTEPYAAYLQLPYYSGGDMLLWLTVHQPEMWHRKALLGQLCEALHHMHDHGIGHGDVKLQNVLVFSRVSAQRLTLLTLSPHACSIHPTQRVA